MIWTLILGTPVLFACWFAIFVRWRLGLLMLLAYVPVAGAVVLWLSPNPAPLLFKDVLFVLPTYLSVALVHVRELGRARVPVAVTGLLVGFAVLVLVQMFNPNLSDFMVALVGAKVWLLYLPMVYLGGAALRTTEDLVTILRLMVAVALVPLVVGLVQFALASTVGLDKAIEAFYGSAAYDATQGYRRFEYGATLFRIPSTFSFVAQYGMFTLSMVAVCYAQGRVDPSPAWRLFGRLMMALAIVAALLSGARGNFVFVPLLLALTYVADARLSGGIAALVLLPGVMLAAVWVAGFDPFDLLGVTDRLFSSYGSSLVLPDLIETLRHYPMGQGTGSSTGAARHVLNAAQLRSFFAYEGFYAKTIAELGIPGLLVLVSLFGAIVLCGLRALLACRDRLHSVAAGLGALLVVVELDSFKGYHLDLDPVNVYFWLFAGMLFKLPYLVPAHERPRPRAAFTAATGNIRSSARARPRA